MRIIDTHAHLDHLEDLDGALERARQAGVEAIVCVGMDLKSNQKNLEIKRTVRDPKIFLAMGVHPSEANLSNLDENLKFIREHRTDLHAIGEIGLDFQYKWVRKDEAKKQEQREVFRRHLELAKEFDLPAVIHSRAAEQECFETVQSLGLKKALFHWYSGPIDVLKNMMAAGYFISASPSIAFNAQSRAATLEADINQLLIETDSPVFFNGNSEAESFNAEPKDVVRTLKSYCALKMMNESEALNIFNQNARTFFKMNILY